jgi:hypothetical protein
VKPSDGWFYDANGTRYTTTGGRLTAGSINYRVEDFHRPADGDDYGPALRRAYRLMDGPRWRRLLHRLRRIGR